MLGGSGSRRGVKRTTAPKLKPHEMFVSRTVLYRNGNVRNHFCAFLFSHLCPPPDLRVTPDSEPSFFILHFSALPLDLKSHSVATCRNFHREKERGLRDGLTARSDRKESTSLLMTKRNETKQSLRLGRFAKGQVSAPALLG